MKKISIFLFALLLVSNLLFADTNASRYFYSGDGNIRLKGAKSGAAFSGIYRRADGTYDEAALKKIHAAFSARYGDPLSEISLRFIEFLDYLEDKFNPGATMTIVSGYRSPTYNTGLRNKGRLAAKASMHQYGMAADIQMQGVPSKQLWEYVRDLGFGGAGYYHGANVHLDVGPSRFWDEATSKVGTDISDDNKQIVIVTDRDIYRPGEEVVMRFIRMTLFPIGIVPSFTLERQDGPDKWKKSDEFRPTFPASSEGECPQFADIGQMLGIRWRFPDKLKPGIYRITAYFCGEMPEGMPASVATSSFKVEE